MNRLNKSAAIAWCVCLACAIMQAVGAQAGSAPIVVAVLPLSERVGPKDDAFGAAITLTVRRVLGHRDDVLVVDRYDLAKLMDEKVMGQSGLSDAADVARPKQMIAADYLVVGHYDLLDDGTLVLHADLMPADRADFKAMFDEQFDRDYPQAHVEGPVDDAFSLIERFAAQLRDALPAGQAQDEPAPPAEPALSVAATIGVCDFIETPRTPQAKAQAGVLTDQLMAVLGSMPSLRVVERTRLDAILAERQLSLASMIQAGNTVLLGQMIGADYLLIGSTGVEPNGQARLEAQVLDVATGAVAATASRVGAADEVWQDGEALATTLCARLQERRAQLVWWRDHPSAKDGQEAAGQSYRAVDLLYHGSGTRKERIAEADRLIALALDLSPHDPDVVYNVGCVAWYVGDLDKAEVNFRQAVSLQPDRSFFNRRLAQFLLQRRHDPVAARPYAERAVELAEGNLLTHKQLAYVLEALGLYAEAEPYAHRAASLDSETMVLYARILARLDRYHDAAYWYERSTVGPAWTGASYLRRAADLYEQAGEPENRVRLLRKLAARGEVTTQERLDLAEYARVHNPEEAKTLCWGLLSDADPGVVESAQAILRELGAPPEPPVCTGPVFDLEALRQQGIALHLQVYDGFRFPDRLPYLQRLVEDVLGIPVTFDAQARPLVTFEYERATSTIDPHDGFSNDLVQVCETTGAVAALGLTSVRMEKRYSSRTTSFQHGVAIMTTYPFESKAPEMQFRAAGEAFPGFLRLFIKQAALCPMPAGEARSHQCVGRICSLAAIANPRISDRDLAPCADCRAYLQSHRPEWPCGVAYRPPIEAGPRRPAIEIAASPLLLVGVGEPSRRDELAQVARAVTNSTGLRVVLAWRDSDQPLVVSPLDDWPKIVVQQAIERDELDEQPIFVAVVTYTGMQIEKEVSLMRWQFWWPEDENWPPAIVVNVQKLSSTLRESIADGPAPENEEPYACPQYAKLVVGAVPRLLANMQQCWNYGCPATVFEDIAVQSRCSYWLCPDCRRVLQEKAQRQ